MGYSALQKLRGNIKALGIALAYQPGNLLSEADQEVLRGYAGFGGIKAVLFGDTAQNGWIKNGATVADLKLFEPLQELYRLLKEKLDGEQYGKALSSLKESVLTAFYTPDFVPETLFQVLQEQGISPKHLYEPSAGSGAFITAAIPVFHSLETITVVEKDLLTGKVLEALLGQSDLPIKMNIKGFEETPIHENGQSDFVISNIPFGNFSVYDPAYPDKSISGKIHNYFFAKGLDKLANGGMLAYITTDGFLNSPSNRIAREHLLNKADLVSVLVMPDNLMKESGGTEAPSHLLIVQKNDQKISWSENEQLLLETVERKNEFGKFYINSFIALHENQLILGNEVKPGKNQYGAANQSVWQTGNIEAIADQLRLQLLTDFQNNFNKKAFETAIQLPDVKEQRLFTFLPIPAKQLTQVVDVQLDLFNIGNAADVGRAMDYITELDQTVVEKQTAKIISTISTTVNPEHESIVLLTAKTLQKGKYLYKLVSNVKEVILPYNWISAQVLHAELKNLAEGLKQFDYEYSYAGEQALKAMFRLNRDEQYAITNIKPFYKEEMLYIHQDKIGVLYNVDHEKDHSIFEELANQDNKKFYSDYILLRNAYLEFSNQKDDQKTTDQRELLDGLYDRFVQFYGLLNLPVNARLLKHDKAFGILVQNSLERKTENTFVKADVLLQSLQKKKEAFRTDVPLEALAHSLNETGAVSIQSIADALGKSKGKVFAELDGQIYLNPSNQKWETADAYLSGNVVEKWRIAKVAHAGSPNDLQLKSSLDAIEKVQPERIPFSLLDFNFGERWIPAKYYSRYASEVFETDTRIVYFSSLDTFKVQLTGGGNVKTDQEYAIKPKSGKNMYGASLLEHALENTAPFFTYEVDFGNTTKRYPDNEATQLAHQKIESLRHGFVEWLQGISQIDKDQIEALYNDTFNCYRLREYDGSHQQFPGLDKKGLEIDELYSSQINSVWRIVQNRGALVDHEVGLGKTLTMILAAQEMKRLTISHKPLILALKANVDQIRETYRKAYPHARIVAPSENEFTPAKRVRIFHEIKNNNFDCVILTHDQFGKIPQSPQVQKQIFSLELEDVERDLDTIKELGGDISKKMLKGLEIRKKNLAVNLQLVEKRIEEKKDEGIDFEQLGIDHLFIDESHKFKNLTFTTRHNRVAGLGNTEGSQKALNLLFAIRTLQQRFDADLCATFLSGTPISNSLTELYLIFKYLRPKELVRQGISNFDGWAAVFAKKTTDFEFSVTNEIIAKERFRHFIKVPELALFYNEITDYKTAAHIQLDKPELEEILVNIPPTPDQQEFTKKLISFAQTGNASYINRPPLTEEEDRAKMLIATNYAKKMAVDMRMINEGYSDHPNNKINTCARNIGEIYWETNAYKGTQLVFCDVGTPGTVGFNVYQALKEKLVRDFGIPENEIAFIHDWQGKKKVELFRLINAGEIRVLEGSTEMLGVGSNVQCRVVAQHDLDIPWRPSDLEQRDGRGARQGNWVAKKYCNNKVRKFIYATEQSLDNYKFNLLKNKQLFISQMKNNELIVRSIDEGSMDEKTGMNFSEYIAILSGDTTLLEKTKLDKKIAVLENLRKANLKEKLMGKHRMEQTILKLGKTEKIVAQLKLDNKHYISQLTFEADGSKTNALQLDAIKERDNESLGKYIIALHYKNLNVNDCIKIGCLYGYHLYVRGSKTIEDFKERNANEFYACRSENGIKYTYNGGYPNLDNPKLAARYFLNAIDQVQHLFDRHTNELSRMNKEVAMLQIVLEKPFEKEMELQELKRDAERLGREITLKIQQNQLNLEQEELEEVELNASNVPVININTISIEEPISLIKPVAINVQQGEQWQQLATVDNRGSRRLKL